MKTVKKFIIAALIVSAFYFSIGIFVIQPIGAVPDGRTIIYFRFGLNLPFISSADGLLIESGQGVSLLGRMVAMAGVVKAIENRKIVTLPYSNTAYLISTGGQEFER